jgi:hypothetical protein
MGLLDKGLFVKHVLGNQVPTELADRIFRVFSNNQPGIGWRDFVCNMVVFLKVRVTVFTLRNPGIARRKASFRILRIWWE